MKVDDKVIVVTGGGSGIGRQLVLELLKKGAIVAATDINESSLQETKELAGVGPERLSIHQLDISDKVKVDALPEQIVATHGVVDGVINNAGIIQPFVDIKDLDYDWIERIMNIDFYGAVYMTKSFLPYLLDRPEAHIANVSSMGGFIPFPGQTMYGAAKAALKLFTEGLNTELKDTTVGVTVVHPGAVNTNISGNSSVEINIGDDNEAMNRALDASKAASIIIDAIEKNKFRVLVGGDARFLDIYYRISPEKAVRFIVKKMGAIKNAMEQETVEV